MKKKSAIPLGSSFLKIIQHHDGFLLLFGVGILLFLYLNDFTVNNNIFSISLILVGSSVLISFFLKRKEILVGFYRKSAETNLNSVVETIEEKANMKKIIFDDLQANNGGKFVVKEVIEENTEKQNKNVRKVTQPKSIVKPIPKPILKEFQIADYFDVDNELYKNPTEPHIEFDFLLYKVLSVIKEILFGHTVAFFWVNNEKQQLVCEAKVTDSSHFTNERKIPMRHDIVSKIAQQARPEIITRVNPISERELIIYYTEPQFIKSFVGVPIFIQPPAADKAHQETIAVLAIDCKTEESFGAETLLLLGQFTKLISGLIKSYTDKYDLLLDVELLNAIHRFQEKIKTDFSISTVSQSLADEVSKLLKWDFISIVLQDDGKKVWTVTKVLNRMGESYIRLGTMIDFNESIIGEVIKSNTHKLIEDTENKQQIRFFAGEKIDCAGSFVSVPISSMNKCFGTINVESKDKYNFSKQDIEALYRLSENAASALEIFFLNELIREYVIIDELTGVYSQKFFNEKFSEELIRSEDFGEDLSLLFLNIDNTDELTLRYGQNGLNTVLVTLSKVIRNSVRPYDLVGRLDNNRFSIVLVKTPANEAYLWAEKIRKTIAGVIMEVEGKSFSVTTSIGVCGATEGITKNELIKNAQIVLEKSIQSGGNTVRVY